MAQTNQERGRITARVPQDVQDTLEQAAELLGATLNQFVVQAALTEARRVIERDRVIQLTSVDAAFLLNLLEKPPAPKARLRKAEASTSGGESQRPSLPSPTKRLRAYRGFTP